MYERNAVLNIDDNKHKKFTGRTNRRSERYNSKNYIFVKNICPEEDWNVNLLILLLQCLHCNSFHLFLSEGDTLYAYSTISDFFTPVSDLNDNKTAFSIIISNYRAHRTALNFFTNIWWNLYLQTSWYKQSLSFPYLCGFINKGVLSYLLFILRACGVTSISSFNFAHFHLNLSVLNSTP